MKFFGCDFFNDMKSHVDEIHYDALGNVIAHKQGNGKRIMFVAHRDVVRLMVTHIDEDGFLYIKPSGGIDTMILPARKVIIKHEDKYISGIIGKKPIHLIREEQNTKVSYDDLWIDIGAANKEDALKKVCLGDYVYFCTEYEELSDDIITAAYFDDYTGLHVLIMLAEELTKAPIPWDVYFVASNHEEIGMRGAFVAANSIKPDICICVDVAHATDYPSTNSVSNGDIKLGKGCVLAKGPNIYCEIFNCLKETAIKHKIDYQIEVSPYPTGTDANVIQLSGEGVKTGVISIPCRYMHTPNEVCSKRDIHSTFELLNEFIHSNAINEL